MAPRMPTSFRLSLRITRSPCGVPVNPGRSVRFFERRSGCGMSWGTCPKTEDPPGSQARSPWGERELRRCCAEPSPGFPCSMPRRAEPHQAPHRLAQPDHVPRQTLPYPAVPRQTLPCTMFLALPCQTQPSRTRPCQTSPRTLIRTLPCLALPYLTAPCSLPDHAVPSPTQPNHARPCSMPCLTAPNHA